MTPTAKAYTRMHAKTRIRELQRAARPYGICFLIALAILAVALPVIWDAPARIAADQIAAQMEGGW